MRDHEANKPTFTNNCIIVMTKAMIVAPATAPVAYTRISMDVYPIGDFSLEFHCDEQTCNHHS